MDIQLQTAILTTPSPDMTASQPKTSETFQDALTSASSKDQSKIADAAKQFEALMLGQLLKTARQSSQGGWLGTGDDQAGELALDMAEQQFAQAMTAKGGLGIAKLVTKGLQHGSAIAANSGSPTSNQAPPTSTDSRQ